MASDLKSCYGGELFFSILLGKLEEDYINPNFMAG